MKKLQTDQMYDKHLTEIPLLQESLFHYNTTDTTQISISQLELLVLDLKRERFASTSSSVIGASFIAMVAARFLGFVGATSTGLDADSLSLFCKISDSKTGQ